MSIACVVCGRSFEPRPPNRLTCNLECRMTRRLQLARANYSRDPEPQRERCRRNARSYYAQHHDRLKATALARYHQNKLKLCTDGLTHGCETQPAPRTGLS